MPTKKASDDGEKKGSGGDDVSDDPTSSAQVTGETQPPPNGAPGSDEIRVVIDEHQPGSALLRDLIWLHTSYMLRGIEPSSKPSSDVVTKAAARIQRTITSGPAYTIAAGMGSDAAACSYGSGKFLRQGGRAFEHEQARNVIVGMLLDAIDQRVSIQDALAQYDGGRRDNVEAGNAYQQELYADNDGADASVQEVDDNDVLLQISSMRDSDDGMIDAHHEGNKTFRSSLLDQAGDSSSSSAVYSGASSRADTVWSVVDRVKKDKKGRFLVPKLQESSSKRSSRPDASSKTREWANVDPILVLEAATVFLWKQSTTSASHGIVVDLNSAGDYEAMKWPSQQSLAPPSKVAIDQPTEHDVLFGRGGLANHHPGNKRFRDVIAQHRPDYIAAIKVEKPNVARKIIRAVRNGNPAGRFLKKDPKDGMWYDVGDRHAAEKASQALRERPQAERREKVLKRKEEQEKKDAQQDALQHQFSATSPTVGVSPFSANGGAGHSSPSPYGSMPPPPLGTMPSPPGMGMTPNSHGMASLQPGHGIMVGHTPLAQQPLPPGQSAAAQASVGANKRRKTGPDADEAAAAEGNDGIDANAGQLTPATAVALEATGPIDADGNVVVTDSDILCGRGGLTNHHRGNKRFRDIVGLHRQDYVRATKVDKPGVARLIVSAIRNSNPPGRFLKKDTAAGKWFDIGDKRAAEKASQALREKTPEERVRLAQQGEGPSPVRQYLVPSTGAAVPVAAPALADDSAPSPAADGSAAASPAPDANATNQISAEV